MRSQEHNPSSWLGEDADAGGRPGTDGPAIGVFSRDLGGGLGVDTIRPSSPPLNTRLGGSQGHPQPVARSLLARPVAKGQNEFTDR
jgi:hypothetical protein